MLADHPIDPMILASDLAIAREFYGERIALEVLIESDEFVTFRCGGDSRLVVTRCSSVTTEPQTKASWRVSDLAAEVAQLRSRGVKVEDYASKFPGHLGVDVFRPQSATAGEYRTVYRFEGVRRRWIFSEITPRCILPASSRLE